MPLITDEIIEKKGRLLIWQLTETEETLVLFQKPIHGNDLEFDSIKHPLRRKQKLATRILLSYLDPDKETELGYTSEGKPYLKNRKGTISLSGCKNYVALIYHEFLDTGIDIEEKRKKILRIEDKFVNEDEKKRIRKAYKTEDLHIIWGAKEAAFKLIGGGGIDFKNHLEVLWEIGSTESNGNGKILFSKYLPVKEFIFYYRHLEDYILVYTIVENKNY